MRERARTKKGADRDLHHENVVLVEEEGWHSLDGACRCGFVTLVHVHLPLPSPREVGFSGA